MGLIGAVRRCVEVAGSVGEASLGLAGAAASTVVSAGVSAATLPLRVGVDLVMGVEAVESMAAVARELVGGGPSRRCWRGGGRAWVEVRGLSASPGPALADAVLDVLQAKPGVRTAQVNVPLSRVVVSLAGDGPTLRELCDLVAGAESRAHPTSSRERVPDLPGDGVVVLGRLAAVSANGAGLCVALAGRALGLPALPGMFSAAVTVVDYQPRLRRIVEDLVGSVAADTIVGLSAAAAHTATQAPASLAVDLMIQLIHAAEGRAGQRSWGRWEPGLAEHADCSRDVRAAPRPRPRPPGPVERHGDRSGLAQVLGSAAVGLVTRSFPAAATAAAVAAPKAARSAREGFAGTLARGLADAHGVLALRPEALRRLDRVDVVLFDPRVVCTGALRIQELRGAPDARRGQAWRAAVEALGDGTLRSGWHRLPSPWPTMAGAGVFEVLVCHGPDPLASAVFTVARGGGAEVMSLDVEDLGDLRSAFDDLRPMAGESAEVALGRAVRELQHDGHTVAVVTSAAAQALSDADVGIGLCPVGAPPPWHAHLMVADVAGVWRVLHSLGAARAASRSGVQLSIGASVLGALLMVPGVRGRGPGPVTAGAAAGLWSGYRLARGALGAEAPAAVDVQEWHAMSVAEVLKILPAPVTTDTQAVRRSRPIAVADATWGLVGRVGGPPRRLASEFVAAVRAELADPLTPVLAIGAAASAALGSPVDAVLVGSVLAGNAALAAAQQVRAQRLLSRLLAVQVPPARRVFGDGSTRRYEDVEASGLRPGDVIEVRTNEVVPADGRLLEVTDLEIDEAALTGESLPVTKQVAPTPGVPLGDRACVLFAQTTVVTGTALAVVTAVGDQTQARRALSGGAASGNSMVGLQAQLAELTDRAWPVSLAGGAMVGVLGLLRRGGLRTAVASGVAVSVAAVPEGLPLVATLAQQASARRLTRAGALVRSPRSVEALGRVDVVCFDKTGTLSENRLRVARVHPAPGTSAPDVLACASRATAGPVGGRHLHATDAAVVEAAASPTAGPDLGERLAHLPFRSGRAFSASVCGSELLVKGAPEVVLAADAGRENPLGPVVGEMAADGLRVIAVARRTLTAAQVAAAVADPDALVELCGAGLQMVGLFGLADTPRPAAAGLLAALAERRLGVRIITGDHPITAVAIAAELGLDVAARQVITGAQWEALPRRGQERAVTDRVVFARMSPENKVQVVQTLERTGVVCAMVGDGANDAAAMRAATVGVGVVSRGSDPARLAADLMLLDGRIEALLEALDEGRQLWRRVQAAVAVLLGGNAGEVAFAHHRHRADRAPHRSTPDNCCWSTC